MSNPANERCQAIDIVRLYAMLAMLFSHAASKLGSPVRLAGGWDTADQPLGQGLTIVLGTVAHIASPIFVLLTGVSLAYFVASRQRKQRPESEVDSYLLKRGALLLFLGIAIDSFRFVPPRWTLDPDILGMFGMSLWLLIPLRRLSPAGLYLVAAVLTASVQAYLVVRGSGDGAGWIEGWFLTTRGPGRGLIFPILPWLPVILLGFASGRLVAEGRVSLEVTGLRLAGVLLALGSGLYLVGYPFLFRKYPPTLDYLLPYVAAGFVLLALHARFRQPEGWWFYRHFIVLGRCALFFYLIHLKLVLNTLALVVAPLHLPALLATFLLTGLALLVLLPACRFVQAWNASVPRVVSRDAQQRASGRADARGERVALTVQTSA